MPAKDWLKRRRLNKKGRNYLRLTEMVGLQEELAQLSGVVGQG